MVGMGSGSGFVEGESSGFGSVAGFNSGSGCQCSPRPPPQLGGNQPATMQTLCIATASSRSSPLEETVGGGHLTHSKKHILSVLLSLGQSFCHAQT